MALRIYKLDSNAICVSSDHNRVVINERMLDNDAGIDIHAGPAGSHMKLLTTIVPPPKVGDVINGLYITDPRRGMVVEQVSSGRIYCYLDNRDLNEDGFLPKRAWYSPGSSEYRDGLVNTAYKVLKTGE